MSSFVEQQNQRSTDNLVDNEQNKKFIIQLNILRFLRQRVIKGLIFLLIFSTTVPLLIYLFLIDHRISQEEEFFSCLTASSYRVSCGIQNITKQDCLDVDCCFDNTTNECYHYLPSKYNYLQNSKDYSPIKWRTPLGNFSIQSISLYVEDVDENRLKIILKHLDEIPKKSRIENKTYRSVIDEKKLFVDVFREKTNDLVLTTRLGPLIASNGYWEWTFRMTTEKLWGLGEIAIPSNTTIRKVIYKNKRDHNTLPIFMAYVNGSYHGIVVEHQGPLEVTILPSHLVILRSIAGNLISLHISMGPTPADVVRQQRTYKFKLPPYWALGPHICREGYTSLSSIVKEYKDFKENEKNTDIKYASDCLHENLHLFLTNTTKSELDEIKQIVEDLQKNSKFLISMQPQILIENSLIYNEAVKMDILYKNKSSGILNGTFLGEQVAYPDYTRNLINDWFSTLIENLVTKKFDGFTLTNNWPSEEVNKFINDGSFPYINEILFEALSETLPWNVNGSKDAHILLHNSYGSSQAKLYHENIDSFLMTASYDYGDPHAAIIQNVNISWTNLKHSIHTALYHSIFANPLISIPVCGDTDYFDQKLQQVLCMRWYITAATMPIFRISSSLPRRDPSNLATGQGYQVAKDAIKKRNALLPYYYTILSTEEPLMRPMFYNYYWDKDTFSLGEQYMIGDALLFAQPVSLGTSFITIYFPKHDGFWFEFWGGEKITKLGNIQINIVPTDWITYIAAGKIIPMRNDDGNSTVSDTLTLVVALNCTTNNSICHSDGNLFLTKTTLMMTANSTGFSISNLIPGIKEEMGCKSTPTLLPTVISNIKAYGLSDFIDTFTLDIDLCSDQIVNENIYFPYNKTL